MQAVHRADAARRDLIEHCAQLADNAETSFALLARQPGIGSPLTLRSPELAGTRRWRVDTIDNHLAFYTTQSAGITIVRVLHAARDWWRLLGLDG